MKKRALFLWQPDTVLIEFGFVSAPEYPKSRMRHQILNLHLIFVVSFASQVSKPRKTFKEKKELMSCLSMRKENFASRSPKTSRIFSRLGYFVWHLCVSLCVWLIAHSIAAFSPRNFTWLVDFLGNLNRSDSLTASSDKCFQLQLPISSTVLIQFLSLVWEGDFQGFVYYCGISSSTAPISCNCYFHAVPWQWQIYTCLQVFILKTVTAIKSRPHLLVCSAFFSPLCLAQFNFCPAAKITGILLKYW